MEVDSENDRIPAVHALTQCHPPKLASAESQHRRVPPAETTGEVGVSKDEEEEAGAGGAPLAYDRLTLHFGVLEKALEESGNGEAGRYT